MHGALWYHTDDPQTLLPRQVDLYLRKGYTNIDEVQYRVTYSGPNVLQSATGDVEGHPLLDHLMYQDPSELMVMKKMGMTALCARIAICRHII